MNISTKGRYAIRALSHLSESYRKKDNKPISIKEISTREHISNRYLENIFVKLRKAGIVLSLKGEKGGFKLARAPEKISLAQVLNAVENEMAPSKCVINIKACDRTGKCGIRKIWVGLHKHINTYLDKTSLKEIENMHLEKKGK